MSEEPRVGQRRPGGRAARVRASVLDATTAVLDEVGYDGLSIEVVASRAGVHKTTVYRRWPTKPELVGEAVQAQAEVDIPVPDTGSLREDLRLLARSIIATNTSDAGSLRSRSLIAASTGSDELTRALHGFWAQRMAITGVIVERAIARGEVAEGVDPTLVIEAVAGPLWLRLLLTGEPLDDELADAVADLAAAGAQAIAP
ncbi:MAG: TetR/AcrR family transcriptional regulator [Actinomycetota bacterium]